MTPVFSARKKTLYGWKNGGKNFAVFCSGQGTNLQAIIDAVKNNRIKANLALVVCDNPKSRAITRSRRAGIETVLVGHGREDMEFEIQRHLERKNIRFIALAGFMRILSDKFVGKFKNRILNIHPALLPSFKGARAINDALRYGVKVTGCTVHFVTEEIDGGPIILQESCPVNDGDSAASILARVHKLEHKLYPRAINLIAEGKLKIAGRKVFIK